MMSSADTFAGDIAREITIAVRIAGMADADMPIGVEHALVGEDAVRSDQILDQSRVERAARGGGLRASNRHTRHDH